MVQKPTWFVFMMLVFLFSEVHSEKKEVNQALVQFVTKLSPGDASKYPNWGWNSTSDPCLDSWYGVTCSISQSVSKIVLSNLNLTGTFDPTSLCMASSLVVLSLESNSLLGCIPSDISNCKQLTHLYLSGNKLSGKLPQSLAKLGNLKRFDISNNDFSGDVPYDLSRISGLITFLVQDNKLSGNIPNFDFHSLMEFNVSNNNFSGHIPVVLSHFNASSFSGNPGLCGEPLSHMCPSPAPAPAPAPA